MLEDAIKDGATNEFGFNENRKDRGRLEIGRSNSDFNRFGGGGRDFGGGGRDFDGGYGRDRDFGGRDRGFGRDSRDMSFGRDSGFGRDGGFGRGGGGMSFGRGGGRDFRDRSPVRGFGRERSFDQDRGASRLGKGSRKKSGLSGQSTKGFIHPRLNTKKHQKNLFLVDNPLPPPLPSLSGLSTKKKNFFAASLLAIMNIFYRVTR